DSYIVNPAIRSYLLLQNAALPATVRISALNLCANQYLYDNFARAFRQSVGDKELMAMDGQAGRDAFRHMAAKPRDVGVGQATKAGINKSRFIGFLS
ncbi:MAG: hypothetical protein NXI01_05300, partial [Gammaproteobacteria bacterium]|nr:hypothetical protein [Gammaproteobacteria bacterium]